MSIKAVGWALDQTGGIDPTAKLVLIALAEAAHRDDDCAWLSRSTLAEVALVSSTRTADRCLATLIDAGLVEHADPSSMDDTRRDLYESHRADRRPKVYRLLRGANIATREPTDGVQTGSRRGADGVQPGLHTNHRTLEPETGTEKTNGQRIDADFNDWWETAVWRKVGKGQAIKAYRTARKKTDAETLVSYAVAYSLTQTDARFMKHPATWLNGECWLDESVTEFEDRRTICPDRECRTLIDGAVTACPIGLNAATCPIDFRMSADA